jgi:hypothetical protein
MFTRPEDLEAFKELEDELKENGSG